MEVFPARLARLPEIGSPDLNPQARPLRMRIQLAGFSLMEFLELRWREHIEGAVAPPAVVERPDVFEDRVGELDPGPLTEPRSSGLSNYPRTPGLGRSYVALN